MLPKAIDVVLTKTYNHKPLVTVRNLPGGDADMSPAYCRALAAVLMAAADECEARPIAKRNFEPATRSYPLEIGNAR